MFDPLFNLTHSRAPMSHSQFVIDEESPLTFPKVAFTVNHAITTEKICKLCFWPCCEVLILKGLFDGLVIAQDHNGLSTHFEAEDVAKVSDEVHEEQVELFLDGVHDPDYGVPPWSWG